MVNNSTSINKANNHLFNSDDQQFHHHHCLEVIVRFVDTGGIADHHCLEVIVSFVDTDGITDHHCLEASLTVMVNNSTSINKANNHLFNSDAQQFHQYQQSEQSPL
jgi:hypothetical protein